MTRRYYAPDLPPSGGLIVLGEDEARHAARVMRAQVGDEIVLFDGRGHQSEATIRSIDKRNCAVQADAPVLVNLEPTCLSHFGIAFPKPDRAKELIERLTELGVNRVTPLVCERTQRPPTDSLLIKLRRIVIESCKQCERNVLMTIDGAISMTEFIGEASGDVRWIAHPDGCEFRSAVQEALESSSASVLIGPEGGFTDNEVALSIESGFQKVGLGKRIYRVETAASVIAATLAN